MDEAMAPSQCAAPGDVQDVAHPQNAPDGSVHHLLSHAMSIDRSTVPSSDGRQIRYPTLLNVPHKNYVAQTFGSGHEFAIGGTQRHVVQSLAAELAYRPEQRWHIVAVKDDSIDLLSSQRRSYSLVHGANDGPNAFAGLAETRQPEGVTAAAARLLAPGRRFLLPQSTNGNGMLPPNFDEDSNGDDHLHRSVDSGDVTMASQTGSPQDAGNHCRSFDLQPQHGFQNSAQSPLQAPLSEELQRQRMKLAGSQQKQQRHRAYLEYIEATRAEETKRAEEAKKKQEEEDAATIEADGTWDNYTGTNLCRWCGRRGHEAVQCIKWDPDYFDKEVCTKCNNKKHLIDECPDFTHLPIDRRERLLVVDGANRPGVRSYWWPWDRMLDPDTDPRVTATPMRREFIKTLATSDNGSMWSSLWMSFPYGDSPVPDVFHDTEFDPVEADETFSYYWPLMVRDDDSFAVEETSQEEDEEMEY